jgi:hypothetical protein
MNNFIPKLGHHLILPHRFPGQHVLLGQHGKGIRIRIRFPKPSDGYNVVNNIETTLNTDLKRPFNETLKANIIHVLFMRNIGGTSQIVDVAFKII